MQSLLSARDWHGVFAEQDWLQAWHSTGGRGKVGARLELGGAKVVLEMQAWVEIL